MDERETGRMLERVDQLTTAVEALTHEMKAMREAHAYGKGILAGLLLVAGAAGAGIVHAIEWVKVLFK